MSIASEIERLQTAKSDLKTSINTKTDAQHQITTETLDDYADFVDSISTGSSKPEQSKTTNPSTSQVVVTPDTGYTLSSVTVNAMPIGALNTPTINSSTGLVTATIGTSGYLASGTNKTLQLSTQSAQTITPTTTDQTISSGKYLTGTQTISGDTNLVAGNIKKDVTIFGVTGTHEGGGSATLITKSITQNGTYNAYSDNADGYSQVTVNVSGGEVVEAKSNDVNFYDYDGTKVYSYTKEEFLELQSMPENPTHTGLISQGWNWSLQDAKEYVNDYGKLDIGQMYVTDDGKTRIYVTLEEGRLEPYLSFAINGTAIIDWGDNSTNTITGTSTTTRINTLHEYTTAGDYVITIESEKPIYFIGYSATTILWRNATSTTGAFPNDAYRQAIKKIELGSNVTSTSIGDYAFSKARSLKSITIPHGITAIKSNAFEYCLNLNIIIIPSSVTSVGANFCQYSAVNYVLLPNGITQISNYSFSYHQNLRRLIIPSSVTSIGRQSFEYCQGLASIIIPSGVTSILAQAFQYCYGMKFLDCTKCLQIPSLNSYTFNQTPNDFQIIVPDDLYEEWIAASGWSSYSSKIIKESEWNNS